MADRNGVSELARLLQEVEAPRRVVLVEAQTPVRRLEHAFADTEVWLKDDSLTNAVYGGNKPRKLEYLIGAAQAWRRSVVTFGFESSNHALATAYHCAQLNVPCHLILVVGPTGLSPADEEARHHKMQLVRRLATSVQVVPGFPQAFRQGTVHWLKSIGKSMIIPPGGSNALGTLGYVRAGLELAHQIQSGQLPEPAEIHVPIGTGGTALGLAIGVRAAGLRSKVVAAKVVPGAINELPRLRLLARGVRKLLRNFSADAFALENLVIEPSALGAGYGQPTQASLAAVERWRDRERLKLESTYSAKSAAQLETAVARGARGPLLFWLTYSEFRGSM